MPAYAPKENSALEAESTLTERHQTTIPAAIRLALQLSGGDKIHWALLPGGQVVVARVADEPQEDETMSEFLAFLEKDIKQNPQSVQKMDLAHAFELTEGMNVDIDDDIFSED